MLKAVCSLTVVLTIEAVYLTLQIDQRMDACNSYREVNPPRAMLVTYLLWNRLICCNFCEKVGIE